VTAWLGWLLIGAAVAWFAAIMDLLWKWCRLMVIARTYESLLREFLVLQRERGKVMSRRGINQQRINQSTAEPVSQPEPATNRYAALSWTELRREASKRQVVSWRRKRDEIEAELLAQDAAA